MALTGRVNMRVTDDELLELRTKADISGLSVSEYARRCVLGRRIAAKTDIRLLSELRKQGGLMKLIHNETRGAYSRQTAEAIQALTSCARTLERRIRSDWESPSETPGQSEQL